jgi:acyl-coenzyme A thioesterase PaaI-like protein
MSKKVTAKQRWLFWLMRFYPPFLGAGIRVCTVSDDLRLIETEMKLHWWNRNYVGTHFGGSLFAMCDPFYMVMLVELLGRDYIVWDKAASIRFRRPGRGTMRARFEIPLEREQEIRTVADAEGKIEPVFKAEVVDQEGEVVAEVEKLLYVRRKDARRPEERSEEKG